MEPLVILEWGVKILCPLGAAIFIYMKKSEIRAMISSVSRPPQKKSKNELNSEIKDKMHKTLEDEKK